MSAPRFCVLRRARTASFVVVPLTLAWLASGCWSIDHLTNGVAIPDAAVDASDAQGPAPGSDGGAIVLPCAQGQHVLCDDFESGLRLGGGSGEWDSKDESAGGVVEISTAFARSGSHALHATVPRNGALVRMVATLSKELATGTWSRLRVQMDAYVVPADWQPSDTGNAGLGGVGFYPSSPFIGWSLTFVKSTMQMYVARPSLAPGAPVFPRPRDGWLRFSAEWDPAGNGKFIASADGVTVDERTILPDSAPPSSGGRMRIELGLSRGESGGNVPTPPLEVYIDDVVVDAL